MKLSNPSHSINFGSVGLTQSGFRDWRRFHAKLGFKYWSEKALGTERKSRDDDAAAHLGGIIDVVPTGKENEGGKGHRLRLRPVVEQLARHALCRATQPKEMAGESLEMELTKAKATAASNVEKAKERVALARSELALKNQEGEEEHEVELTLAESHVIKCEGVAENIEKAERKACRNGVWKERTVIVVKEETTGTLMHRQVEQRNISCEKLKLKMKLAADGRYITRQMLKGAQYNQCCFFVKVINSADSTASIRNCHTFACCEGGEKESFHMFEIMAEEAMEIQSNGITLTDVYLSDELGNICKVRFTICIDH